MNTDMIPIEQYFSELEYNEVEKVYSIQTSAHKLLDDLLTLKDQYQFIFFNDIVGIDKNNSFLVIYHLTSFESRQKAFVRLELEKKQQLPSVANIWSVANYYEMELWDMLGVQVEKNNQKRILNHQSFRGHPLSKQSQLDQTEINSIVREELPEIHHSVITDERNEECHWVAMGPCSNNIKKPLQLFIKVEENKVLDCIPKIGHVHRGVEKLGESLDYFKFNLYADRLNFQSSGVGSIAWCKTIEKLIGVEISDRSKALRMVFLELGRMIDHLTCLANICKEVSFDEYSWRNLKLRDSLLDLLFKYNGKKFFPTPARIGGLSNKLPYGWGADCMDTIKEIKSNLSEIENELLRSRLWMDALKVCDISSRKALSLGVTGPALRACGINFDLRKDRPYYFYEEVEFEVPLGVRGDVHDRYLVRFEEIKQSINIITQVMDNLPIDKTHDEDYNPDFWFNLEEITLEKDVYEAVESANGEFGFFVSSLTNKRAKRVKVRTPSFNHIFTFPDILKGNSLDTVPLAIESLNIIPTEHDR